MEDLIQMDKKLQEQVAAIFESRDAGRIGNFLIEYILPNHISVDFVSMLLDTRRLQVGESLVKKVRKGIEVQTLVPGSIHMKNEITVEERMNYILDGANVGVTFNDWDMKNGHIGTVDEIRQEMILKLRDFHLNKVFTALSQIWTAGNTPNNYTNVGGSITASALEDAIDNINQTAGGVKAVVGVRSAMSPITKFGAFWNDGNTVGSDAQWSGVDSQLEKVMREGQLGVYYGAPLVHLEQSKDNIVDNNNLLPTDKILVIGHNVGEWITYGDPVWKPLWADMRPTPIQWFLEFYQQFGMIIDNAEGIHVLGNLS